MQGILGEKKLPEAVAEVKRANGKQRMHPNWENE